MNNLSDSFGRSFPYIRLSITDVCNFKCGYCLPNGYFKTENKPGFLHLKEISNCLAECFRVLKPSGHLIDLTPSWEHNYNIFYDEYTHLTPFTPNSLKTVLKMNNFKIKFLENFIQIPFFWKIPSFAKIFAYLLSALYSINKTNKLIKYSKEQIILGIASK